MPKHNYFLKFCPEVPEFSDNLFPLLPVKVLLMFGGDTIRTALPEWTTGTSTEVELSSWCPNQQNSPFKTTGKRNFFRWKAHPRSYLVTVAVRHRFPSFRDDVLGSLKETHGLQLFLLAPPLRVHDQMCLVERIRGGGVRGDRLNDDAVAGAEAVRLRRVNEPKWRRQTNKQTNEDANWPIDCGGWCVRGMQEMGLLPRLLCHCWPDWEAGLDWTWSGGSRSLECWWAAGETTDEGKTVVRSHLGGSYAAGHHPKMGTLMLLKLRVSCTSWHHLRGGALQAGSQRSAGLRSSEWWFHCRWRPLRSLMLRQIFKKIDFNHSDRPQACAAAASASLFRSPRWVICSGIWTGICKAATELGAGLLVSSTRVSRICSDEEEDGLPWPEDVCEEDMSSWRPLRRTGQTHG